MKVQAGNNGKENKNSKNVSQKTSGGISKVGNILKNSTPKKNKSSKNEMKQKTKVLVEYFEKFQKAKTTGAGQGNKTIKLFSQNNFGSSTSSAAIGQDLVNLRFQTFQTFANQPQDLG
jgi:hypothetical protein